MRAKLVLKSHQQIQMRDHVLGPGIEPMGFFLCRVSQTPGGPVFIVDDVYLVPRDAMRVDGIDAARLSDRALLEVVNRAVSSGLALAEAHGHGRSSGISGFSLTDDDGLRSTVPFMLASLNGLPYAATVWTGGGVFGLAWNEADTDIPMTVTVSGDTIERLDSPGSASEYDEERFTRQVAAFGDDAQRKLTGVSVGIVGLSGLGSPTLQSLVYLGVRNFVLIDPDDVEESNLNRIVTAKPADLGLPKADVAARYLEQVAVDTNVETFPKDLRSPEVLDRLKSVDVIVSGVDNDGARFVLNEMSKAFRVPLIDSAVEIDASDGKAIRAGGRVSVGVPDGPCLLCAGSLDLDEVRFVLSGDEEKRLALTRGYVTGVDEPAPSVVGLNAVVSGLAVNEFHNLVVGLRKPSSHVEFDLIGNSFGAEGQRLIPTEIRRDPQCDHCAKEGLGDDANIERYALS